MFAALASKNANALGSHTSAQVQATNRSYTCLALGRRLGLVRLQSSMREHSALGQAALGCGVMTKPRLGTSCVAISLQIVG